MPYPRLQNRILLPLLLGALAGLLAVLLPMWLHTALPSLIPFTVFLLSMILAPIRTWTYQPSPAENPARVTIFRIVVTLLSLSVISLYVPWLSYVFFNTIPFILGLIICVVAGLSLLAVFIMFCRDYLLERAEQSTPH